MQARTVDSVDKEIAEIDRQINERREAIRSKKRERRSLLRKERDQLRYITGGLIFDHLSDFEVLYPGLVKELYSRADTRDRIKFVRAGFVKDNLVKLVETNKGECQKSVKEIEAVEEAEDFSEVDQKNLEKIKACLIDQSKNIKRKIYGRKGECMIYTGPGEELYISDKLAAYLIKNEAYSE